MTALHKLEVLCPQVGAIPHLLGLAPQTPAGLLAYVASGELLTSAQRDYLVRLNFLLALEAVAESERLRQFVLTDSSLSRESEEKKGGAPERVQDGASSPIPLIPNPDTAAS